MPIKKLKFPDVRIFATLCETRRTSSPNGAHSVWQNQRDSENFSFYFMIPVWTLFLEGQQQIAGIDAIACSNVNLVDNTVLFGNDSCL